MEALLERGVVFEVERRGWWRWLRPRVRMRVDPPTLGVLYAVSGEFAQMEIDERRVEADPLGYSFELVRSQMRPMARAVAFAVLGARWKIRLFAGMYARILCGSDYGAAFEVGGNGVVGKRYCGFYKLYQIDKGNRPA